MSMHLARKHRAARRGVTAAQRCRLVRETYEAVLAATESFAPDDIGSELAYLLGALADSTGEDSVQLDSASVLLRILRAAFPDRQYQLWWWVFGPETGDAPPAGGVTPGG